MHPPPEVSEVLPDGDRSRPRLFCRWHPAAGARGAVLLVHGFGEHSGRYEHVFSALNDAGWSCLGLDYRGFGRAAGRRAFVRRFDEYLDDVAWGLDECRRRAGAAPVLLAHSQGGLVAAALVIERRPELTGLALSSPALGFAVAVPRWKRWLGQLASTVWPTLALPTGIDPLELTREQHALAALREDPLVQHRATARWYTESLAAQRRVLAGADRVALPPLLLVAGADRVVDRGATRAFFERCAAADKTWCEYADARHEVLQELPAVRAQALADLIAWLARRR